MEAIRMEAIQIAEQTLAACEAGHYAAADGARVEIAAALHTCAAQTRHYVPEELARLRDEALARAGAVEASRITLSEETTLAAAARLVASGAYQRVGALNFASARHPGGGFLSGALAQEESLARSSGLYHSLLTCPDFYDYHRAQRSLLYSDRMIYSPDCPVIRDDAGGWLSAPYLVDFITSAAPNAAAIQDHEPEASTRIPATLTERVSKMLGLAAHRGCDALVLGAWGCGAFGNNPVTVAGVFHNALRDGGPFARRFRLVHFAVRHARHESPNYAAFARHFGGA